MTEIDQFAILRKLRNRLCCDDFSALARKTGSDSATMSRIKQCKTHIPPRIILNAAAALDVSPKKLMSDVGLPENYFLKKMKEPE